MRISVTSYALAAVFCLLMAAPQGCSNRSAPPHSPPLPKVIDIGGRPPDGRFPKGVEMYSWRPEGSDWRFSLVPGTNRRKTRSEVMDPKCTIIGVENLRPTLATLAEGESLFLCNLASGPLPENMNTAIVRTCKDLGIKLQVVQGSSPDGKCPYLSD